ncbi:MAG TPA: hypothetical protein VD927_01860 [Chryseosolibacter sp.]|nr:hypothetical protein [Chryseosolibacter sp.]
METEAASLEKCRLLIEKKLSWGDSECWQNQDFENLSELILSETKVSLSGSTLKRLWGRVQYTSSPNLTTLNALAQFAGYESWRKFVSFHQEVSEKKFNAVPAKRFRKPLLWMLAVSLCIVAAAMIVAFRKSVKILKYSDISFSSSPVTNGLPNTVIFNYNASDSNADSVFIQQSWDPRLRQGVDKNKKQYASTYYYPGYYRAKLVLNDSVVREHDVYVKTQGWLATINAGRIPQYITESQLAHNGIFEVTEDNLKKMNIDLNASIPEVSFYNVQDFGTVPASDFEFETALRSTFNKGGAVCQHTKIALMCSNGYIVVPLSIKGCVGELKLIVNETTFEGSTTDLSRLGVDFSDWVNVKIVTKNSVALIEVNGTPAFETRVPDDLGKIVGLRIRFKGTGQVRFAELKG